MKLDNYNFSRKIVLIFAVIIWQSSLGTTYAKADLSNAMSVNLSQNGYAKFNNGLLIQWGYSSSSSGSKTIYMPTSFYDVNYSMQITFKTASNISSVISPYIVSQSTSYFVMKGRYIATNSATGDTTDPFTWFAIGRWK